MGAIEDKIKYYEQKYFSNDEPIPFIEDLKIHPVLVKDYYTFYSSIPCFTMNKNEDNEGIVMSNLEYLFYRMQKDETLGMLNQFITILELVFNIDYGIRCPRCNKVIPYSEINKKLFSLTDKNNLDMTEFKRREYLSSIEFCDECHVKMSDNIKYLYDKDRCLLFVNDIKIDRNAFDELRKVVCYQNMPDYDDSYIDPELKADLEEAARLRNPNNVQPTLEKQECCIVASSAYTFDTIKNITIRKLVMLLRTIDTKLHYFAYRQAEASGMVTFSKELDHWIYGNDKQDKFAHIQKLDDFKAKIEGANK